MFENPELFVSRLLFVGLILEALETYRMRQAFDAGGIFSRANLALLTGSTLPYMRIGSTLGGGNAITVAIIVQAFAALIVIVWGTHTAPGIAGVLVCLAANAYLRARRQIGGSGAEQLTFIVLVTFGLVVLAGATESARRIGDVFIAAQVLLAYLVSGISKAASPVWRTGGAMAGILSTEGYGIPSVARFLSEHPFLDRLICSSVITWECAFPLVLIAPRPLMIVMFATGVLFHLSCAIVMGLNRFVWAFCGCYPAVWATAMLLR